MAKLSAWKKAGAVFLLCAATAVAAPAQTFTNLSNFDFTNGDNPWYVSLAQGVDGNFYGTTYLGGNGEETACVGCGVVFKVTPTGALTSIYDFCNPQSCVNGNPAAGLVLGTDGNFYGTTFAFPDGSVFKITPEGTLTVLYDFCEGHPCADGAFPYSIIIQGTNGNLYGTTSGGGRAKCNSQGGCGTLYEMTPQGTMVGIYRFCAKVNCPDGRLPEGGLVEGADGSFYGTTEAGGASDAGTVFKITQGGKLTTLYNFCSKPNCSDGDGPWAATLIQATDGNFYGITAFGGNSNCLSGCGTIFKITQTGTLTTLYAFCAQSGCPDGSNPFAGLIQATDGNFYGTTSAGGTDLTDCTGGYAPGCGTIFQITPGGELTTLHSFSNTDGAAPYGGLLQATNGTLYGTTEQGGMLCSIDSVPCGTIFSVDMGLGSFVAFVRNPAKVGQAFGILGQGFKGTASVSLNGIPATFSVKSDTFIKAQVPAGGTTGYVTVTTPSGTLTSNVPFHVIR